jgi:hypothetical protein
MHRELLIEWPLKHDSTGFGGNGVSLLHNVKEPFTLGAVKQEKRVGGSLEEVLDFVLDTVRGVTKNSGKSTQLHVYYEHLGVPLHEWKKQWWSGEGTLFL